ncbi:MAG: phosphoglycerate kinase, partial [Endomicrobia bacterium]|nr:phosphoglycerate kinase [Endomicrobiia bacterium]
MFKIIRKLNYKKIISVVTAACFTFSIFATSGFTSRAFAQNAAPGLQTVNTSPALNPSNFVVPFNIGRVTDSVNFKSDKVIVQIQDLHAHEETQRNIANILSLLDSKYKINKVYVEGAVGGVDTSWLANISDENLKNSIINSLLSKGILTGSELFSVNSGKTKILEGIEDKKAYIENFNRLVKIDSQRDEVRSLFPEIRTILSYLAEQHYGKENKRIEAVVNRYKNGKLSFDKYFSFLVKKAKRQNVYFGFYPSIVLLSDIISVQNKLNKDKVNSQIESFLEEIKSNITYGEYKELIAYSSKPETEGVFYFKLAEFYNKGNYGAKYPELAKFLQFIGFNQTINPLDLVNEERALLWEVRNNAAKTNKERELLFLGNFIDLMEGFLENKITAPEYKYFEKELPKFKALWTKYTRMSELPGLEQYYSLFESFYKVNVERNNIFVKEMSGKLPKTREANMTFSKDMIMTGVAELLANAKEVEVVVTGGFHTQDVSRILQNANQSYVVITPNVTQDAALADKLFVEDVIRISKYIPTNTFQKALPSGAFDLSDKSLKAAVGVYFQKDVLDAAKAVAKAEGKSVAEVINGENSLKDQVRNKGLSGFDIEIIENKDGSYTVTAKADGISGEYTITESGIVDSAPGQAYDVKEAGMLGGIGVFAVAALSALGIVLSFPLAPAIAVFGIVASFIVGLGIASFSAASVYNAGQVQEALISTTPKELTAAQKKTGDDYVAGLEEKYNQKNSRFRKESKKGLRIVNVPGLDVIARTVKGEGGKYVIAVNALALMKLNEDLVDNIILNHELMHVRGLMGIEATKKFEVIAHIANTFSLKNMRSYNFKQKNTAVLNFYKALDEYNAVSVFNPANKMDIIRFVQHIEGKAEALINAIKVLSSYGDINQIFLNDIKVALEDIAVSSPELNETVSKLKTFYGVEEPIAVASSEQEARGGFTSYRSLSKGRLTQQEIENNRINRSIQGKLNEYNIPAEKISILDKTELVQLKAEGLSCTTVLEELLVKAKVVDSYSGPRHIYYIKDNAELKKISDYLSKPENIAHLKLVQAVAHYKEKNEISLGGLKYGVTQFNKKEIYTLKWDAKYARKIESLIDNNKEAFNGTLNRIRNTFEFTDKPSKETTEAFFKAAEEAVSPIAIEMVTTPSISSKMTDEQYKAHLYKTITNRFAELGITISPEDTPSAQTKLIVFHHTEQYNQQSEKYGYIIEKIGDILRGDEIGENRGEDISDDFERTEFFVDMTSTAVLERLDGILNEAEKKFPRPTKVKQILAAALSLVLPEKAVIEEDMTGKATVDDLAEKYGEKFFEGKTVILRADLNVKLEKKDGKVKIIDNNKIKQTAPTIRYLTERGAKVIVITHLADPEADEDENLVFVPEENLYKYDLSPVADEIASLTGKEVKYCEDVIGDNNSSTIKAMNNGDIALLGNLRKKPDIGEKTNSEEFVKKFLNNNFGGNLENIIYVTDAFGTTHRSHASIEKLPEYLKNNGVIVVGGHLMAKELKVLEGVNKNPRSPLLKVLGGSKVTKKMNTVNMSLSQVEKGKVEDLTIIIGGPMAFAFIAYKFGKDKMGGAKIEEGDITFAGKILDKEKELRAQGKKIEIVLPKDFVTIPVGSYNFDAHQFNEGYSKKDILVTETYEVPAGREPMDVGPKTIDEYKKQVERVAQQRGMFLGNGPLGVVEDNENGFDEGTIQFMMAVIEATEDPEKGKEGIISAAGGGETMIGVKKAIKRLLEKFGIKGNLTHGSTGGDAFAQYFEKDGQTPGVKVITSKGELIEPAGSKSGLLETSGVWKKIRNSWWVNGFIRPFTKGNELKVRSLAVAVYEARYIFEMIRKPIKFADRHKLYSDKTKTEILTGTEKLGKDSETAFVTGALGGAIFAAIAAFPISIVFGVLALPVSMLFIGALVCTLVSTVIAIGIISMFYINISGHSKYNYKQLAQAANALGIILDHAKEDVKSKEYASILQYFVGDKSAGNFDLVLEIINNPGKIDEYIEKSNIVKKQDLPLSQQPLAIQIKETLDQMLLLETDSKQASKIKELLRALPENLGKALGLGVEEFLFKQSDLDGTRYTVFQVPENSGIRGEWLTNAIKKYIEDEEEKGKTLELGITNPKRFERSFIIWENMYDSMAMTLANLEAVVGFVNELKNLTDDEVIKQVDRQKAEIVAKMPLNEAKAGRAVGKMLREVVLDPNSKSSKDFLNGGYNQPGWGVAAKAVLNGSFAVDESGNQGYYTEEGKQKFLDDVARKRKFFHDRPKPIKVFIKPGIGGQNTPFKGLADGFKVVVYGGSEMLGEYELGKDYETELNDLLKKMGIGWDQVAVMPSSKSGSTDETMMIYSELLYLQLKYIPATQNINNIDGE